MEADTAELSDVIDSDKHNTQIKREFDDGGILVRIHPERHSDLFEHLKSGLYYVPTETVDGLHDWIQIKGSYRYNDREQRGEVYGTLVERTDFLTNSRTVPLAVAMDGKKAIAAYLYGVRGWDKYAIASHMDRAESTVRQYISDYKAGRTD